MDQKLKVSVIIPTLNEEARMEGLLSSLRAVSAHEIILVDGGSQDRTVEMARALTPHVIVTAAGRAHQMNEGARYAAGEVFLFLHADTRLERSAFDQLTSVLSDPTIVGGAFSLRLDSRRWELRLIADVTNLRARLFSLPYGDQVIFVRRDVFEKIGGYAELPLMEDFEFIRRLKRHGRIVILSAKAVSSARRWEKEGILYTTLRDWAVTLLFLLGVSPAALARWYPPVR
jgi:rSAM/selenodomain-associated transferase 2